jgi:hypothetical protein
LVAELGAFLAIKGLNSMGKGMVISNVEHASVLSARNAIRKIMKIFERLSKVERFTSGIHEKRLLEDI